MYDNQDKVYISNVFLYNNLQLGKTYSPIMKKLEAEYVCKDSIHKYTKTTIKFNSKLVTNWETEYCLATPTRLPLTKLYGEIWTISWNSLEMLDLFMGVNKNLCSRKYIITESGFNAWCHVV